MHALAQPANEAVARIRNIITPTLTVVHEVTTPDGFEWFIAEDKTARFAVCVEGLPSRGEPAVAATHYRGGITMETVLMRVTPAPRGFLDTDTAGMIGVDVLNAHTRAAELADRKGA